MAPNGTRDLVITDEYDQLIDTIPEAVFGGQFSPYDSIHNMYVCLYGESVSIIEYSDEDIDHEAVINGDYSDIEPVCPISLDDLYSHITVSPMDPNGDLVIKLINKHGIRFNKL
jgi:hypothetical protein